ncbi:hypothetical protein J6590_033366 [Homalodisca vitripennis]|nr:hypothetical protein J6590_033366 [Homalodisca vitripennis]
MERQPFGLQIQEVRMMYWMVQTQPKIWWKQLWPYYGGPATPPYPRTQICGDDEPIVVGALESGIQDRNAKAWISVAQPPMMDTKRMEHIVMTLFIEEEVKKDARSLRNKNVPGPDGISGEVLKVAVEVCGREHFPKNWKRQRLVLVSKGKENPSSPSVASLYARCCREAVGETSLAMSDKRDSGGWRPLCTAIKL